MLVLLTGGSGFIGKSALDALATQAVPVVACARSVPDSLHKGASFVPCDLLDKAAVSSLCARLRPTHLLHLAWGINVAGGYWSSSENLRWLDASLHLMRAFAKHGGQRFVGAGTCAEYSPVTEPRNEHTTPTVPDTLYGKAKLACGNALSVHVAAGAFTAAWCRLFYLTGPGEAERCLIPSACRALRQGQTFHCRGGEKILDYMDVRDAVSALLMVLFSDLEGTINIASGVGIKVRNLLELLAKQNNLPPDFLFATKTETHTAVVAATERLYGDVGFRPEFILEQSLVDSFLHSDECSTG